VKKESTYYIEMTFYYIILFLILREWLVPVVELTSTGHLKLLLLFIAIAFLLNIFEAPFLISWIIKVVYISWFIVHVYTEGTVFSSEGIQFLISDIRTNISLLLAGDWEVVTDPFRSLLFFILIWMLIYLIHHWLTVRKTIFYFFVLTVFFISTLDSFTTYDGKAAIVKVVILGLVMTGLLYMKRLIGQTGTTFAFSKYIRYILPMLLTIVVVGFIAVLLPKAAPQWPDPVPYIKNLSGKGGQNSMSQVGIGEDDSRLGGSFEADDTVVFTIHSPNKQYWRIETKDFYTSKGWESTDNELNEYEVKQNEASTSIWPNRAEEAASAFVYPDIDKSYVLQAYGMMAVLFEEPEVLLYQELMTERFNTKAPDGSDQPLGQYEIVYSTPEYSYTQLKTPVAESELMNIDQRYLQLPEELPERVRTLAADTVEGRKTDYDRAKAIEQYFKRGGFTYETDDVAVPAEDQDYVDQFLFETKLGYCDNFSTSMVVMLRSVGIPARWVKGYANGTEVDKTEEGLRVFEVENNDAHSWVEAYIDGIGWMPFEPTIGFVNQSDINFDMELDESAPEELIREQDQERKEMERQVKEQEETEKQAAQKKSSSSEGNSWLWIGVIFSGIMLLLVIVGVKTRRKWMPKVYIQAQRRKPDRASTIQSSYKVLMRQLAFLGLKRKPDETLQAFAERVDKHFGTGDMSKVTTVYEKTIYSKETRNIHFDEIKESWEYLINRTTG
jgi:transglutaminase-like putative cysteine protease